MATTRKRRRPRGTGSVYQVKGSGHWWFSYRGADGLRHAESSHSARKGDAQRLLQRRTGAREHNLPIVRYAEQLTFTEAAQAVIDDFTTNGKKSVDCVQRHIDKHLTPYFGAARRLAGITSTDITAFIARRQKQGVEREVEVIGTDGKKERKTIRVKDVSNGQLNRELQTLKRIFSLAVKTGRLAAKPYFKLLREDNVRAGFFEPSELRAVLKHLPPAVQPVIQFAAITGWRIDSEVLPLQWRNVDFHAGEVTIDAGKSKTREPRRFPMTAALRTLLEAQQVKHKQMAKAGHIVPCVFFRDPTEARRRDKKPAPIRSFSRAWKEACHTAGYPGRIPHDLRRSAVRHLVRVGIPERVAMTMTGHQTRSVFERYDITSFGDQKDAARKLDAADASVVAQQQAK